MDEDRGKVHISNVTGDVIAGKLGGIGNISGKTVNINHQQLNQMPVEYSRSLAEFEKRINELFSKYNIPKEQTEPIQKDFEEFTNEVTGIKSDKDITIGKKIAAKGRFAAFAEKMIKVLPKTAETVAAFTPLSPFSKIIGESVEQLINAIQKEYA